MEFPLTVGIFIYDRVELLDFTGPFEVFAVSGGQSSPTPGAFQVKVIAGSSEPATTRGGLRVLPDYTIDEHPELHVLIVPGGPGTEQVKQDSRIMGWLREVKPRYALASVSSGAILLAEAGRLNGYTATASNEALNALAAYEKVSVAPDMRFVDNGTVLTSSGVSAGMDMALRLVRRFVGDETVAYTTRVIEYEHRADTPTP